MPDTLSPADRKKTMQAVKGKNTSLERKLWSMIAGMRISGWSKNAADVPGKPDAAFLREKVAIFVDGCFWHHCPHCNRPLPETNREYWEKKIHRNVGRDQEINEELRAEGWEVVRIWGHEIKKEENRKRVRSRVRQALSKH
jgi:DNA mismatch endonuclease (patch repair protein)